MEDKSKENLLYDKNYLNVEKKYAEKIQSMFEQNNNFSKMAANHTMSYNMILIDIIKTLLNAKSEEDFDDVEGMVKIAKRMFTREQLTKDVIDLLFNKNQSNLE